MGRRGLHIGYKYTVKGRDYIGRRYRYDENHISFDYRAVAESMPPASRHRVYYNPANPADAVLSAGLDGGALLQVLFGIPLNVLTFAIWIGVFRAGRDPGRLAPAGGVRILQQASETRARLAEFSPWAAGFFGLAVAAFAAVMLAVFAAGFAPSLSLMSSVLVLAAATAVAAFVWTAQRHRSGRHDLRIDEAAQTLILPPADGRTEPLTVPLREMVAVGLHRRVSHSPSGRFTSYVPALERSQANGEPQQLLLVNWGWTEGKARAFSAWLSQQLGIPFKGTD